MLQIPFETPIFFCAGEPSGDMYAGLFIRDLKKNLPHLTIYGVGGPRMRQAGAKLVFGYEKLMTFGLGLDHKSLLRNYRMYRKIARELRSVSPRIFIAVAYPGMNLLLCRIAKQMGMRVYYLLPPQIWAWGTFRKYFVKKWVDVVVSVFPFEANFYERLGISTVQIDNPLLMELKQYRRNDRKRRIGFMPGSRSSQIRRNVPVMHELIRIINACDKSVDCCLILYEPPDNTTIPNELEGVVTVHADQYQVMKNCDLLVVGSGTASLEAAIMDVPQIFFHRISYIDDLIMRRFLHIREINLANLYYGKALVPCIVTSNQKFLINELSDWVLSRVQSHKHLQPIECHNGTRRIDE